MKKHLIIVVTALAASFIFSSGAQSAEIYFGTNNKTFGQGTKFEVGVFVDSQGESINAIEGQVRFPTDKLIFEGFYTGNSTITFWVKQPAVVSEGAISFAGIIPGGFNGEQGYLFSLLFSAKAKGSATLETSKENILLNDGQGTPTTITKAPLNLTIGEAISPEPFAPLYDSDPPEDFVLELAGKQDAFDGKWFLSYWAQDKGSGIDHYEVLEKPHLGSIKGLFFRPNWVIAESPYVLQDQSLASNILVWAIDRAGNQKLSQLRHQRFVPLYENYFFYIIIIIIGVIYAMYKFNLWRYFKRNS